MTSEQLVEQLLALPDPAAQQRLLEQHTHLLDDDVARALKEQADRLLHSEVGRALEVAGLLYATAELRGNSLDRALGLLAEANARSIGGLGEFQRALELYDQAAEIYQQQGLDIQAARAHVGKVFSLAMLGRYDTAIDTGYRIRPVLEAHEQWQALVNLSMNLAVVHGRQREDARALEEFNRTRDFCRRLGPEGERQLALVEGNRAIVLRNLGRFERSIEASQEATRLFQRFEQHQELGRVQENLAFTCLLLGRYNEALELLDQARATFMEGHRLSDALLVDLTTSYCLLQLRRFSDVLDRCLQVRELSRQVGMHREAAQATLNQAVAYTALGRFSQALESLEAARQEFEQEENQVWVAAAGLEAAALLYHQGKHEESLSMASRCAAFFHERGLDVQEARGHVISARAATALEDHERARELLQRALAVGQERSIPSLVFQCQQLLGLLARVSGDRDEALLRLNAAIEVLEQLRGQMMIEFRADFLGDKQAVYEDMVAVCLALNRPLSGLEYAERAKSRALLDLVTYRLDLGIWARDAEDQPLVDELVRLRAERDRLYRRADGYEELQADAWAAASSGHKEAERDVLALEKSITDLWHRLLIRNADYARDASLWQVRAEPVQPHLPDNSVLLEYFLADGQMIVFVVTRNTVQAIPLGVGEPDVRRLHRLLQLNLLAVPNSQPQQIPGLIASGQGILQRLHDVIIAPVRSSIEGVPTLILVPHGPLHYLPLHALYDGRRYLIEQHEITQLPGASLLRFCCDRPIQGEGLLAFGHSYQGRLPHAVREARAIAELLGGEAALEESATRQHLRNTVAGRRVLHLAVHGDFRPDNPLFSGLALADGWLTTLDIFGLRLNASLATLSACQTGRHVVGGGDELLGLMRALIYAGAASLLLSLWSVADRSTAELMESFYRHLAQGRSKVDALRQAQMRFIQGAAEVAEHRNVYAHPYFWAPFFLVGDPGPL